jgi:hypothetical protein
MNFWKKLKLDCAALSLNCREASRAQSEMLDHALPRATRIGLWLHLLICKWCRRYGKQLRFLRHAAHEHQDDLAAGEPQKLSSEARARIKRRLQEKN